MKKITVRLPEELHDRLVEISRRDTRSINSTVLVAIERYCGPRPSYEDQVLEAAAQCLDDENERLKEQGGNVRVLIEDNVRFAATIRDALATDAGEKAAAVIAAATEFWRDRTQRIGPLDPSVVDRLLAAVAAREKGDG